MNFWRKKAHEPAYRLGVLEIRDPWARIAHMPALPEDLRSRAGGYFVLSNPATAADRLVAASCRDAAITEIHAIKVVGSGITMRPLDKGLAVPPETTLTLKPRGYHLMFIDLKPAVVPGGRMTVRLEFEIAGILDVELPIREIGPVGNWAIVEPAQPG